MSVTAEQAQQDLDNLTANVLVLLPSFAGTLNDLVTIVGQLLKQLADLKQTPQTTLDPAKVSADVASIKAQLAALGVAQTNAQPFDTIANPPPPPPPAPAASTDTGSSTPAAADGTSTPPASGSTPS